MIKSDIIKSFNPNLNGENERIVELYSDIEERIKIQKDLFKDFSLYLLEQHSKMKTKLEETELKVNNALFGDKKFFTETLTLNLPLEKEYFNDDVSITNGILTPKIKVRNEGTKNIIPLSLISSRRETDFKILNNKIYIDKNVLFPYQELEIRLPKNTETGFLYVFFDRYEKISVLNKFGKEIQERSITNQITIPVNEKTGSIIIRFEDNKNKILSIKELYTAQSSFETSSVVETKPIIINQYLKSIGINTCDNYSEPTVDIKYYISINNGDYREIRPLNKQKNLDILSIISTDDRLHSIVLTDSIETDLGVKYPLNHLDTHLFYIQKAFKTKLGVNKSFKDNKETLTLYSEKDNTIIIHQNDKVMLNGINIVADRDNFEVKIPKGFNTLSLDDLLWNQKEDLLKYNIIELQENHIILENRETNEILSKEYLNPREKGSVSVFLQLVGKVDFYSDEYKATVSTIGEDKFVDKEGPNDTFLFVKYKLKHIETIQIKIDMKTNEPKIPAYLSSLTIRGV